MTTVKQMFKIGEWACIAAFFGVSAMVGDADNKATVVNAVAIVVGIAFLAAVFGGDDKPKRKKGEPIVFEDIAPR
jgi:hypothetical protein